MVKATFGGNALALERVVIAHSSKHQKELEQLAWGVQYEVARGVTCGHWTWDDLTPEKLLQLRGRNAEAAHKVIPVMRGLPVPERKVSGLALWRDMDREQSAILENKGRGLGLMGEYDEAPNWYGGKIQQVVHLHKPEGSSSYSIFLKECEMRRSNRFARFLGSRRLLALHVPDKLLRDEYKDVLGFLCRKFVLMGRTYVPLHAKDGKLYLVEISEDFERRPNFQQGDQARLSLEELIRWYNPLAMNAKQPISKYTTRFALGFSTSVPVLEFEARNIHFIPDQIAPGVATRNAGPEQIMTDGCGFMNGAALLAIKNRMGYKNTPTAVQGRVAGSKGLWILHPNPEHQKPDGAPEIWIRDSQKKISLPEFSTVHRAHLIFDLICASRLRHPGRSSMQTVLNLHHNGVPTPVLTKLLSDGLRETAEELTNWDGPYAALLLMSAIDRAGRVSGSKLQRLAGGMSRALGFSGREFREAVEDENPFSAFDDDEDYDADDKDALNADFAFDPSSPPLSLHESAFELLRSGFLPLKSRFLSSKVREILTRLMEAATLGYHITIPWSLEGFIVPDPFGILGEGEVYLRTTREFEGMCSDTLEGPVLLSRNPTRVASDIQKVMAVKRPQLADYSDVLVVSTKGDRSLASYLGGGDTVMVVWDRDIVEPFRNARLCVPEPDFIAKNFHRDIEQVSSFVNRTSNLPRSEAHSALIKVLLQGMGDRKVGIYSKYHDIAVHSWGLAHAPTERLAHMFTHLLDSDKTGLRVNRDVMKRDQNQYDCAIPDCMKKQGGPDYEEYGHKRRLPRMKTLGPCVLCELMAVGKTERDRLLSKYDELQRGLNDLDQDVTAPWEDAERRAASNARGAEYVKADLDIVEDHVKKVYQAWRSIHWGSSTKPISSASPTKKVGKKSGGEQKSVEEMIQDVVKLYREGPTGISVVTSEREVSRWKAARAFKIGTYFAFRVAFWDICGIKAEAKGRSTSTGAIANLSTIPPSVLKVIQPGDD
ncbi:hypothetical protein OE88DRAFT_1619977 [Heliocybe sulcata]|uniref:RNA-dependent RNA polymerase n=1 Tax=Heliocybe sulcata TaxID=5364 RepID=A0A5C3NEQ8_9AGAM|nr:hypothetical protein OE88DRAFT_1619977 [Heliocybe sulcata]